MRKNSSTEFGKTNTKNHEVNSARDFIYLTGCMLQEKTPDKQRLQKMDFEEVYRLSKNHMLSSAIYMTLERSEALSLMTSELADEWRMSADAVIRQTILMNTERKAILSRFETEGIWYMPLKGCIIADYYPDFGMREMSDNDILFDRQCKKKVRDIMLERGYRVIPFNGSDQDVYMKDPVYNFEMHKDLMNRHNYPEQYAYFADLSGRLIRNPDKQYEFRFSNEDFYIYFIVHAYKHYEYCGGTGLRTLVDLYLLNRRFEKDREYLDREFRKLQLSKFEGEMANLAETVFSDPEKIYRSSGHAGLTYGEKQMLEYILGSGVYGTKNNSIRKKLVRDGGRDDIRFKTRAIYILHRLYPKGAWYVKEYPFFYRHVWAYVFFLPIYRILRRGNIKSLIREAKIALKTR